MCASVLACLKLREDLRATCDDSGDLNEATDMRLPQVANGVLDWQVGDTDMDGLMD